MAVTVVGRPTDNINPAYNPLVYYFDSPNKGEEGYRYVAEVEDGNGNLIFTKKLIPAPVTGYGILHLERELVDYVNYNLDFSNESSGTFDADKSYFEYKIFMKEEFYVTWEFSDYGFIDNTSTDWVNANNTQYNPNLGNKTFIYNTNPNLAVNYQNGDSIFIELNPGTQDKPQLQGLHTVLDTFFGVGNPNDISVVLDIPWVGAGTSTGGKTRYADNRKQVVSGAFIVDEFVINTALRNRDWLNYSALDYDIRTGEVDKKPLTQLYSNYTVRPDNTMFIHYLNNISLLADSPEYILAKNDVGDSFELPLNWVSSHFIQGIHLGPNRTNWGTQIQGTNPLINLNATQYSFVWYGRDNLPITNEYVIKLDRSCPSVHSMEMLFMDKFGSFLPFNFNGRAIELDTIQRDTFTKYRGGLGVNNKYTYSNIEGGDEIYKSSFSVDYELNTGYLNNKDSEFFRNIVQSPITVIKIDNEWVRCNITNTSVEVKKEGWYEQKRYTISVSISNRENINI